MNEDQRKWLLDLQSKGVKFEYCNINDEWVNDGKCTFSASQEKYRIQAQPIPDIPDWRELCREMQSKGVEFEGRGWSKICWFTRKDRAFPNIPWAFAGDIVDYRIPQQSLPEWREEMTEETKPDPREEIPHREQQIQWHEDMLHHLRTGEPMTVWEFRFKVAKEKSGWLKFGSSEIPAWDEGKEYRRKPRTITYWHCVGAYIGYQDNGVVDREVFSSDFSASDVQSQIDTCKENYPSAKFSPIIETTVEMED